MEKSEAKIPASQDLGGIGNQSITGNNKKVRADLNSLPMRQYLDQTVAPLLLHGLQALVRERPADPVSYLAAFLLKNKSKCEEMMPEN